MARYSDSHWELDRQLFRDSQREPSPSSRSIPLSTRGALRDRFEPDPKPYTPDEWIAAMRRAGL